MYDSRSQFHRHTRLALSSRPWDDDPAIVLSTGYHSSRGHPGDGSEASPAATLFNARHVFYNPTKLTDPSGFSPCFEDGYCADGVYSGEAHQNYLIQIFGLLFSGEWAVKSKWKVIHGVIDTASAFLRDSKKSLSGSELFKEVYGITWKQKMEFIWGKCEKCALIDTDDDGIGDTRAGAYTHGSKKYEFANTGYAWWGITENRSIRLANEMDVHTVIHELGHGFNARFLTGSSVAEYVEDNDLHVSGGYRDPPDYAEGMWTPNSSTSASETAANMFLGYVYPPSFNNTNIGRARNMFMQTYMPYWIRVLTGSD